ncbi:MAG: substrate-binding domain-containing protein [Desulfobulbaceae bacterium]|nr:substrate-binding domain-containing protein [Desulfobulbaceae bacterium]
MKTAPTHILFALLLSTSLLISLPDAVADEITVAAANSICADLKTAGTIFTQQHKSKIKYICKSSGMLAKGIQGGAIAADYFISASNKCMASLVAGGLIDPPTVKSLWGNRIVVGAAKNSTINLQNWAELAPPKVGTILVGDPARPLLAGDSRM